MLSSISCGPTLSYVWKLSDNLTSPLILNHEETNEHWMMLMVRSYRCMKPNLHTEQSVQWGIHIPRCVLHMFKLYIMYHCLLNVGTQIIRGREIIKNKPYKVPFSFVIEMIIYKNSPPPWIDYMIFEQPLILRIINIAVTGDYKGAFTPKKFYFCDRK